MIPLSQFRSWNITNSLHTNLFLPIPFSYLTLRDNHHPKFYDYVYQVLFFL